MLLLFETAAGYALFKVLKESKLKEVDVRTRQRAQGPLEHTAEGFMQQVCTRCMLMAHAPLLLCRPQDLYEEFSSLDKAQKVRCCACARRRLCDAMAASAGAQAADRTPLALAWLRRW